jgi:hypothetical protein
MSVVELRATNVMVLISAEDFLFKTYSSLLDLSGSKLDCLCHLSYFYPNLREVVLNGTIAFFQVVPEFLLDASAEDFSPTLHDWPHLTRIDLSHVEVIDDSVVFLIASTFPELKSLRIAGCTRVTTDALRAVLKKCPCLDVLDVTGCFRVDRTQLHVPSGVAINCPPSMWSVWYGKTFDSYYFIVAVGCLVTSALRFCGMHFYEFSDVNTFITLTATQGRRSLWVWLTVGIKVVCLKI